MKLIKIAPFAVAGLLLAACSPDAGLKETLGTLGGAALGGLAGAQIGSGTGQLVATAAGVLIGAAVGREIGASLDKADMLYAERSAQGALESNPSGVPSQWSNPDSGNYGSVTPQPAYQTASGNYCREYQTTVVVNGETQQGYGTACRQEDGSWQIQG